MTTDFTSSLKDVTTDEQLGAIDGHIDAIADGA
jgi:hypothetical protein